MSVIIPVLNAVDTLDPQLRALARQRTSFPWEVIVCDDGSTDGTIELARTRACEYSWLTVIDASRHAGPSAARNAGAAVAQAPLLAFCDADDIVQADWLAELHRGLAGADVVAGRVDSDLLNSPNQVSVSWAAAAPVTMDFWPELPGAATNNLAVRKTAFEAVGGFDESLRTCEDIDLCWRAQLAGFRFALAPAAVVAIRKREGYRAAFRQGRAYGIGGALLKRKFAAEAERYFSLTESGSRRLYAATSVPTGSESDRLSPEAGGPVQRVWGLLTRLRRPATRANAAWQFGYRLGKWAVEARSASPESELYASPNTSFGSVRSSS